jgi:hypothetical protein
MRPRQYSDETLAQILLLADRGVRDTEIAEITKVNHVTIQSITTHHWEKKMLQKH